MVNTTEDSTRIEVKKLSNRSLSLLKKAKAALNTWAEVIPQLYESLTADGLTSKEARRILDEQLNASERTIRSALPPEAKMLTKVRTPRFAATLPQNTRLVLEDEKPKLPPREEQEIEGEIVQEDIQLVEIVPEKATPPPPIAKRYEIIEKNRVDFTKLISSREDNVLLLAIENNRVKQLEIIGRKLALKKAQH